MGKPRFDLIGATNGKITILSKLPCTNPKGQPYYAAKCECGNVFNIAQTNFKKGKGLGCKKCYRQIKITHNMTKTRLYRVWNAMKTRCYRVIGERYRNYGGRGISVCNEWRFSFINFYNWSMANGYKEGLSIDRINNDGNYEPSNCRWATRIEQANNTRRNVVITINGVTKNLHQWASDYGIGSPAIIRRVNTKGWTFEKAVTTPSTRPRNNNN